MAVERTVQINIQTNAEEAARSIGNVGSAIGGVQQASAGAAQQVDGLNASMARAAQVSSSQASGIAGIGRWLRDASAPLRSFLGGLQSVVGLASRIGGLFAFGGAIAQGVNSLLGAKSEADYGEDYKNLLTRVTPTIQGQLSGRGQQGVALRRRLDALEQAPYVGVLGKYATDSGILTSNERAEEMAYLKRQLEKIADIQAKQLSASDQTAQNTDRLSRFRAR